MAIITDSLTTLEFKDERPSFALAGCLDNRVYEIVQNMNSRLSIFNCPVTAYKTAYLLEKGIVPKMKLHFPSIPRPMHLEEMVKEWPDLFTHQESRRSYIFLEKYPKETLEFKMLNFGKGTHAIVGGIYKSKAVGFFVDGHCWNYVFSKEGKFIILDSYSSSYFRKGLEKPTQYFDEYRSSLNAIVFFNKPISS